MARSRDREKRSRTRGRKRRSISSSSSSRKRRGRSRERRPPRKSPSPAQPQATAEDLTASLLKLFAEVASEATLSVRENAAKKLAEGGITAGWQLIAAPREVLLVLLPADSCGQELTLVMHCQQQLSKRESTRLENKMEKLGKAVSKEKAKRSKSANSVSDSSDQDDFDATKCLEKYGLSGVPHSHGLAHKDLKAIVKAARSATKHRQQFIISGGLLKLCPQWVTPKHKANKFQDILISIS